MPLNPEDNKNDNLANTDFISEKIKQRPINRKKLLDFIAELAKDKDNGDW